jgi:hypothetical protein
MDASGKQEQLVLGQAVSPSSTCICSSARRTAAKPAAAAISLGRSLGSCSAGSAGKIVDVTRFRSFTRTATANERPVTLSLITCRPRQWCQKPASSDQSLDQLLTCRRYSASAWRA